MWKVVVFPDDEVSAVPVSWLLLILEQLMCFWPENNARLKRAKLENPPSSGNDKWKLHECRVLFNDETFSTFKEALAMEIRAQETSYKEPDGDESDSSSNKEKRSVEEDEFEFVKEKEIPVIDHVEVNETSKALAASESENNLQSFQQSSSNLNNDEVVDDNVVPAKDPSVLLEGIQTNNLEIDTQEKTEVSEQNDVRKGPLEVTKPNNVCDALHQVEVVQLSDSEKIDKILLNQEAEQKIYAELMKRMDNVEKHIKKYGGGSFSNLMEGLTLQVASKEMFLKLETDIKESATKAALAVHFNKTIFEKEIKQFVKILLLKFFDDKFYAHHVTGKSGGTVVLNKSETLSCIYVHPLKEIVFTDCIEKKFGKKQRDVEDTVFKAIDQLKDCLRKKFPKLPADRKRKRLPEEETESVEDRNKRWESNKKRKRDRIRERLEMEESESLEKEFEAEVLEQAQTV